MKGSKINWTPELEQRLIKLYPGSDTRTLANELGIGYNALRSRAKRLGLKKIEGFRSIPNHSIWRTANVEEFKRLYPTTSNQELAKKYGISYNAVKNQATYLGLKKDPEHVNSGRFQKGQVSWNKGKPCPWAHNNGNFINGHQPHNTKHDGAITTRNDKSGHQYKWIRVSKGNWKMYHVYLWEQEHGKVPKGKIVVFKDGNTLNCTINNLELITRQEHARRNSGSINLPDSFVAHLIAGKHDRHLKEDILKNKEMIDLKRKSIILNRKINERTEHQNTKQAGAN